MSLASAAVQNPMFRQAVFSSLTTEDENESQPQGDQEDHSVVDCDEKELEKIKKYYRMMRIGMLVIATLIIITAWYNIFSSSSSSISDGFIAMYLFFFGVLICWVEIAYKSCSRSIVQNFGFMYSSYGKNTFLSFVAILCYSLSTMGKVCFALLLCYGIFNIYVNIAHPRYAEYMRSMHLYNRAKAKRGVSIV